MAKELRDDKAIKAAAITRAKGKALEAAAESGAGFAWIREDGAVCFGDECAVITATEDGKLKLVVQPDKCGEETGKILLGYLMKTAGKGVVIEIPSEVEEH